MNIEKEREAFEAEIRENWGFAKLERVEGDYIDPETQGLWRLWNARAAPQSQDREDAARYRWLRQMIFDSRIIVAPDRMLHGEALDHAIDHARRVEGES